MTPSREALAAARVYLNSLGCREGQYPTRFKRDDGRVITTTWKDVLDDTAEVIEELGLVRLYLSAESRWARKRRAYKEQREGRGPDIRTSSQVRGGASEHSGTGGLGSSLRRSEAGISESQA